MRRLVAPGLVGVALVVSFASAPALAVAPRSTAPTLSSYGWIIEVNAFVARATVRFMEFADWVADHLGEDVGSGDRQRNGAPYSRAHRPEPTTLAPFVHTGTAVHAFAFAEPPGSWRPPIDQSLWRLLRRMLEILGDLWPFKPQPTPSPLVPPIVDVTPPPQVLT